MQTSARRQEILRSLEESGSVMISALSEALDVSEMTIRRDLDALQAGGLVHRTHGGAVLREESGVEPRYAAKQKVNSTLKARIAHFAAAEFVTDGDVIMLEGGTTVTAMARYLTGRRDLTVLTNGLYTTNELRRLLPEATVMCSGGILRDGSFTFVGPDAVGFITEHHVQKLFVSATGMTIEHGYTDPNPFEAEVRRAMVDSSDAVIGLIDTSKFGVVSAVKVTPIEAVGVVVTDAEVPMAKELRQHGVRVLIAP